MKMTEFFNKLFISHEYAMNARKLTTLHIARRNYSECAKKAAEFVMERSYSKSAVEVALSATAAAAEKESEEKEEGSDQ